nr:PREDICTED: WAS/WASL-interacting protein family member 1-like isoform X1 [Bos indicus]
MLQEGWGKGKGAERGCLVSSFSPFPPPPPPKCGRVGSRASPTPALAIGSGRRMGCRGCSTISLGAARGAPYPGAATLRPRPPSPARPEGLRETGPEPCPRALALGRPNHQGPAQEAAQLLPRHTDLASPEISGPGHLQPGQLGSWSAGAQAQQSSGAPRPMWSQGRVGAQSLDTPWPHLIQTSPRSRLHRRRCCFPRTWDRMLC